MQFVLDGKAKVKTRCDVTQNPLLLNAQVNLFKPPNIPASSLLWFIGLAVGTFDTEEEATIFCNHWSSNKRGPENRYKFVSIILQKFLLDYPKYKNRLTIFVNEKPALPYKQRKKPRKK